MNTARAFLLLFFGKVQPIVPPVSERRYRILPSGTRRSLFTTSTQQALRVVDINI